MKDNNENISGNKKNMKNRKRYEKLVCSICDQVLLRKPNALGKPYAVRNVSPILCDMCSHDLADMEDDNQSIIESKNIAEKLKKPLKDVTAVTKLDTQIVIIPPKIKLMDIIKSVRSVIKGQDEQVKDISTAIFKNQDIDNIEINSNLIILGDSGSGKTEIIKLLANEFKVPYVIEDATRFSEVAYYGASVDDMVKDLYKAAGDNLSKAEKGIIIIDEGDKKVSAGSTGRDVSGENVLFSLLKMLEGSKVPVTNSRGETRCLLDTSRVTIIFIGAFPNLVKIRDKRINDRAVGFKTAKNTNLYINKEYIAQDFIEGGFPKEFVGRFDMVVELNTLTIENLENIITSSEKSTFVNYIKVFEERGLKILYSEDMINEIAIETERLKTGARGIKKIVQNMFKNILFQVLADGIDYTQCIITKNTIYDPTDYILT